MFTQTLLAEKIHKSKTIFFFDFDGTLFTPDQRITTSPFYNLQIKLLLEKYNIPFVIVTGRSSWTHKSELLTRLLGLPNPDAVITGAGTLIYYRMQDNQLGIDTSWAKKIQQTKIQIKPLNNIRWQAETIRQTIQPLLPANISTKPRNSNTHLIRLYAREIPIKDLIQLKEKIEELIPQGMKVLFTEKLRQKNTTEIFSGDILLIPEQAGKENAVKYMLENLSHVIASEARQSHGNVIKRNGIINVFCFGDATIDIDMLLLPSQKDHYTMHTYGVNLQPLTKKILQEKQPANPQLYIIEIPPSPQAILEILRGSLSLRERARVKVVSNKNPHFSPAQNNLARQFIQPFEGLLNNVFDKNMTANDISLKGLDMVKQSIDLLYGEKKPIMGTKMKALRLYTAGNFADLFDGIRARQNKNRKTILSNKNKQDSNIHNTEHVPGQLLDTYCDRVKEFYQLYKRAMHQNRVTPANAGIYTNKIFYQTLLAAISCILPSLARAQAEMQDIIVPEKDARGGSMLDRTKLLFQSLMYDFTGFHDKSFAIDQKIYQNNIATFENRLSHTPSMGGTHEVEGWVKTSTDVLNEFQQKALERFLLLTQLLQEENEIIEKELQAYPKFLERYKKSFQKQISKYLTINLDKLREEYQIKNYKELSLLSFRLVRNLEV